MTLYPFIVSNVCSGVATITLVLTYGAVGIAAWFFWAAFLYVITDIYGLPKELR